MKEQKQENESSRQRFKRLATSRTNTVLHRLKVLGNCSNKHIYEYDEKDIDRIFSEIEKRTKEVKMRFNTAKDRMFRL